MVNKGVITLGVAAAIGVLLMKSGSANITMISAALAILTLFMVYKGKGS